MNGHCSEGKKIVKIQINGRFYENLLTVIVVTYNRPVLLSTALSSLAHQHEHSFDVIIFDNGSTDSTQEVIRGYLQKYPAWRVVRIETNWYSMKNAQCFVDDIRTPWVTYLCDDDLFDPNFMSYVLPTLNSECHGLICLGFSTCDYEGKITRMYKPKMVSLTTNEALNAWRTNLLPESAGITGFVFRKCVLERISWDYSGGFFNDTRLALEGLSDGGVRVITECVVVRRQWVGAVSAIDPYSIINRLKAHLEFIRDITEKGEGYRIPLKKEQRLLTDPIALFRNYGLALFDCGPLSLSFLKEWVRFSLNSPHWIRWQLITMVPILFMNRGPFQVVQRTLRRFLREMRVQA